MLKGALYEKAFSQSMMKSHVQAEKTLFKRMHRLLPFVTPAAFTYLVEHVPLKILREHPSLSLGSIVCTDIKSILTHKDVDAWNAPPADEVRLLVGEL